MARTITRTLMSTTYPTHRCSSHVCSELPPLNEWLLSWIGSTAWACDELDSFDGVFHHLTDAWSRKADANVMLVHYADLLHDLRGQTHRIAVGLGIDVSDPRFDELVPAATFQWMRSNGGRFAPDPAGALLDTSRFFHSGRSGPIGDGRGAVQVISLP